MYAGIQKIPSVRSQDSLILQLHIPKSLEASRIFKRSQNESQAFLHSNLLLASQLWSLLKDSNSYLRSITKVACTILRMKSELSQSSRYLRGRRGQPHIKTKMNWSTRYTKKRSSKVQPNSATFQNPNTTTWSRFKVMTTHPSVLRNLFTRLNLLQGAILQLKRER